MLTLLQLSLAVAAYFTTLAHFFFSFPLSIFTGGG